MGRWSGAAAAYDAHLSRWALARHDHEWVQNTLDRFLKTGVDGQRMFVPDQHRVLSAWAVFAGSWGRPREDGSVEPPAWHDRDTGLTLLDEATISGKEQPLPTDPSDGREVMGRAMNLLARESVALFEATTHYMAAPIVAKITEAAAEAVPEPLFDTDLHDRHGLVVFEEPVILPDLHPDTGVVDPRIRMPIRAIGWSPEPEIDCADPLTGGRRRVPGTMLWLYTTYDDYDRVYRPSLAQVGVVTDASEKRFGFRRDELVAVDVCPWAFGTPWKENDAVTHEDATVPSNVAYARRWFMTFMRFCWQTLLIPDAQPLSKKAAARWRSEARRRPLQDVTVLRLRRVVNPERDDRPQGGEGPDLDHRVLVRGHWRRQWFRSLGPAYLPDGVWNEASHRLVWIDEHWRGPDDAPVGAVRHLSVLTR